MNKNKSLWVEAGGPAMVMPDPGLIKKYNVQGPRYTSYPTAVQFKESSDAGRMNLQRYLSDRNANPRPVSLYFHIPFCFSLCWYCGCTKIITKDQDRGDVYLDYLEKEMDLISAQIHPEARVIQIHFGGGTPTFLKADQLLRLGRAIRRRFNIDNNTEFGIEIDPRRCSVEQIDALREIGCNRASLGVQDTNAEVQKAIHRIQPFEKTEKVTGWLRERGIKSVNFDLIYGLPCQTSETLVQTMNDVLTLKPDRLAVYSYAHIPWLMPAQKLLDPDQMPTTDQKLEMLGLAIEYLQNNEYRFIGMDHFSREGEELAVAMDEGTLQRNFQGYSTHAGADLYAFGMSGISNAGRMFWQNTKELNTYYTSLTKRRKPIARLLELSDDDLLRQQVIMQIMCRMGVDFQEVEAAWDITFPDYFEREISNLSAFEEDGLVTVLSNEIKITQQGRLFLRNIAMCFDRYLNASRADRKFSKTV